jgi:uncharacterized glyoxalase superfamily protein PhnB
LFTCLVGGLIVTESILIPAVRYRRLPEAIDWLCSAFGFEKQSIVRRENGTIALASLRFAESFVLVGPTQGTDFDLLMLQPDELGGRATQVCYLVVADPAAHCAKAKAAGAEVIFDIRRDRDSTYTCRDPEGHIWSFGTYDPRDSTLLIEQSSNSNLSGHYGGRLLRALSSKVASRASRLSVASRVSGSKREIVAGLFSLLGLIGIAASFYCKSSIFDRTSVRPEFHALQAELIQAQSATQGADAATKDAHQELALARAAASKIERSLKVAEAQRLDEQRARIAAVQRVQDMEQQLAREKVARQDAEGITAVSHDELVKARQSKEAVERVNTTVRAGLAEVQFEMQSLPQRMAEEKSAREAAERLSIEAEERAAVARAAKESAEKMVDELRSQLTLARTEAKQGARAIRDAKSSSSEKGSAERVTSYGDGTEVAAPVSGVDAPSQACQQSKEQMAAERDGKAAAERTIADLEGKLAKARNAKQAADRSAAHAWTQFNKLRNSLNRNAAATGQPPSVGTGFSVDKINK